VKAGVVRIHTEHNYRCSVTSDDSKAQKSVTYRGKKIQVMQHGLKTANFILEKNVDTSTLAKRKCNSFVVKKLGLILKFAEALGSKALNFKFPLCIILLQLKVNSVSNTVIWKVIRCGA
jgi:hypothetical protein